MREPLDPRPPLGVTTAPKPQPGYTLTNPPLPASHTNQWLRATSWGWEETYFKSLAQRERARRSRLVAWIILGLLIGVVILSPLGYQDLRARATLVLWAAGLALAALLNRRGWVTLAGCVLVALVSGGILFANLASPIGLTMGELPNFDAYVISVVIAATVLPRGTVFVVAGGNTALIIGDYLLQPHYANIGVDAALYSSPTLQTISFLVRPIALQLVLAVVAFLWVRGAEEAIRRADRAEELALLERRERERTIALEEGVRYLHQVLSEWTAGDVRHRIPAMPVRALEQVRTDLNTFIERIAPALRAAHLLDRLETEVQHLTAALEGWAQGHTVVWPKPSGTPLDRALTLVETMSHTRQAPSSQPIGPLPWQTNEEAAPNVGSVGAGRMPWGVPATGTAGPLPDWLQPGQVAPQQTDSPLQGQAILGEGESQAHPSESWGEYNEYMRQWAERTGYDWPPAQGT